MSSGVKWGLITGMVLIVQSLVSNVLGVGQDPNVSPALGVVMTIVGVVATFLTIYMGIKEARDTELSGQMNMGLAVRKGLKIALIGGIILAVYSIIYAKFIDPEMMDRIMEMQRAKLEEQNMPEDKIEMATKMMGVFKNPFLIAAMSIIWTCFLGLIQSLVAGAILKKDAPPMVPPTAPVI